MWLRLRRFHAICLVGQEWKRENLS